MHTQEAHIITLQQGGPKINQDYLNYSQHVTDFYIQLPLHNLLVPSSYSQLGTSVKIVANRWLSWENNMLLGELTALPRPRCWIRGCFTVGNEKEWAGREETGEEATGGKGREFWPPSQIHGSTLDIVY